MTDKLPPQNISAEEEILGSILLDSNAITKVTSILTPDVFYVPAHQYIYQAAYELYTQEKPTDLMTVTTWLSDHKLLRKVGGKNKLAQLANGSVSAVNIERYGELVLEKYHRRQLITAANEISELGYDTTTELKSVFEQSQEKIFNLTTNKQDRFQPQLIKDCLKSVFNKLSENQSPEYPTAHISQTLLVV